MIPIKFDYSLLGADFDTREITHQDIHILFTEYPELLEGNPDRQFILSELDDPDRCSRVSKRNLGETSYENRGTADNLDQAAQKRERCTDWFTNVVCDHETSEVVPFTVLYDKTKRKDVYFIGFAPHETVTDAIWDSQIGMNSTLKQCNYNPNGVVTEAGRKIQNINGGQVTPFLRNLYQ